MARRRAIVLPWAALNRRSPAWAGSPRSSSLAYHLKSLPAPRALVIALETNVDTLQTTQLYVKRMPKAAQVKAA